MDIIKMGFRDNVSLGRGVAILLSCEKHTGSHFMQLDGASLTMIINGEAKKCLEERWDIV